MSNPWMKGASRMVGGEWEFVNGPAERFICNPDFFLHPFRPLTPSAPFTSAEPLGQLRYSPGGSHSPDCLGVWQVCVCKRGGGQKPHKAELEHVESRPGILVCRNMLC